MQAVGTACALIGFVMGHLHRGRQYPHSFHATLANFLLLMLVIQAGMGIYLKLHLERKNSFHANVRRVFGLAHRVLGVATPIFGYMQMIFGYITANGYCADDHLGQCLAHFIMGSSFVWYGYVCILAYECGHAWLRRHERSFEWYDSRVILLWGIINTFTEHRFVLIDIAGGFNCSNCATSKCTLCQMGSGMEQHILICPRAFNISSFN